MFPFQPKSHFSTNCSPHTHTCPYTGQLPDYCASVMKRSNLPALSSSLYYPPATASQPSHLLDPTPSPPRPTGHSPIPFHIHSKSQLTIYEQQQFCIFTSCVSLSLIHVLLFCIISYNHLIRISKNLFQH